MSPIRRVGAVLAGLAATLGVLTACQKPLPNIGVLSGSTYRTVAPSTYCFDDNTCRSSGTLDLPVVAAPADSKVLIDVPRMVKANGWAVRALTLDGKRVIGTTRVDDSHSYRVAPTLNRGDPFIVEVQQLSGGAPDASRWSFVLRVSSTG